MGARKSVPRCTRGQLAVEGAAGAKALGNFKGTGATKLPAHSGAGDRMRERGVLDFLFGFDALERLGIRRNVFLRDRQA